MNEALDPADVERFRRLVARRIGLRFDDARLGQLAETLGRRLEAIREPPGAYFGRLQAPQIPPEEVQALARELTVTETYFFRHLDQFRAFSEVALPDRMRARSDLRRLRILSAGCASGEEAYSLAILVSERTDVAGWDVSIRAVDIGAAGLQKATEARYSSWSLRETPVEVRTRYFRGDGRDFVLDAELRRRVTFEERNLAEEDASFWRPEVFDVVFCRNVIMYLTPETAEAVVARISRALAPGGFLFLGHAETLRGLSHHFHLRHTHGTFYYQRRESGEGAPPGLDAPPSRGATEPPLPTIAFDDSWVETIRHASERVQSLTRAPDEESARSGSALASPPENTGPVFDRGLAVDLIRRERFSEAQAMLSGLPPEAARDADVLLLKAVLLTHGGDLARAEEACRELLEQDEMSAGAHYLMALCREDAGDRRGAVHHDQLASYLDPDFAMPRLHLGLLARRAGDPGGARRELEQALTLLQREDASRVLLFGGGFGREALITLCRAQYVSCGGAP